MSTISNYYKYSELAFASYSSLTSEMSYQSYIKALRNNDDGLSPTQSAIFADTYTVIDQYNDPNVYLREVIFKPES